MPAKIKTPFQTGLDAKVYWTVFIQSATGYDVSKRLAGDSRPVTGPIYKSLKKLQKNKFLSFHDDGKYSINAEKLTDYLLKRLKNEGQNLDHYESEILNIVSNSFLTKMFMLLNKNPLGLNERMKNESFTGIEEKTPRSVPHDQASFIVNLTSSIAITSISILHYKKRFLKFKNQSEVCKKNNQICTELFIDTIYSIYIFKKNIHELESIFYNVEKRVSLLKEAMPQIEWNKENSYHSCMFLLWNLMFLYIPTETLEKFSLLHKDASTALDYVTLGGQIFNLESEERKQWIKSLQRRFPINSLCK